MYALIKNGLVTEVTDVDPAGRYHPSLEWRECPDDVAAGYVWDGVSFAPPPEPVIVITADARKAELASIRWAKETGGVSVTGMRIDTSRESQNMINGAVAFANRNPDAKIDFKAASGWIALDAATVLFIGDLVATHVQKCYSRERELSDEIDRLADDAEALAALDIKKGWPE